MTPKLAIRGGPRAVPQNLPVGTWPVLTDEDKRAVMSVLDRNILAGVFGPEAVGLESDFARYTGAKYAMSTGSGTSALHCAMFAAGVTPGDEVITSAFSFSGSFHPILQQMAIPVFVDIDPMTYNIDAKQIEAKISERTRALLPVHIHGLPADMDEIMRVAAKHGLTVIEDACQAHGAEYKGRKAGTIGKAGAFSLNWTKNLSGGEGGLMITDDEEFLNRAKQLRIFGEKPAGHEEKTRAYTVYSIGYQYRTQELPAALARSQLKRLDEINRNTQANCEYLTEELGRIRGLVPPFVPPGRTHIYHKYRVRFQPDVLGLPIPAKEFRDRLIGALEAEGVPAMIWHVEPLPAFPIFKDKVGWGNGYPWKLGRDIEYRASDYPEAVRLLDESFIIGEEHAPIYSQSREAMTYYVEAIRKIFDNLGELVG